jgi:transcriptional antiterminator NusG
MDDERHKLMEDAPSDAAERPTAEGVPADRLRADSNGLHDDAESNRSDDTALDREDERLGTEAAVPEAETGDIEAEEQADDEWAGEAGEVEATDDEVIVEEPVAVKTPPAPPAKKEPPPPEEIKMDWYILKVQSNRERSIAEALERKMRIEGLDRYFDQVIVPTEKVTEFKGGKKKVVERKLYPGYIVVHMHINDDTWFAVRETSGVGDFTGAGGKPTPMLPHEVARIIQTEEEETSEAPKLDIKFAAGDKVKVKEGNFENFEGEVGSIDEASGRVIVMINIFGRSTPVELEYWQIEAV